MHILHHPRELETRGRKVCFAIGVFDGVHIGHQQVLRQAISDARQHEAHSVAITFDQHPSAVVAPDRRPPLIQTLGQKLRAIEAVGLDGTLVIEFTRALSEKSGEQFILELLEGFGGIHSICVGATFTFGHKRSGNVELLKKLGAVHHFQTHGLAALALDGEVVSSTRIRQCIRDGNLDGASQMLGRSYAIEGKVVEGDKIGKTLGFPTANVDTTGLITPPNGVYAVHAKCEGKTHRAVANLGVRPTLRDANPTFRLEVHLLDFGGDLYGRDMEVTFVEKLRDEQKFASLDTLKSQIGRDIEAAKKVFV